MRVAERNLGAVRGDTWSYLITFDDVVDRTNYQLTPTLHEIDGTQVLTIGTQYTAPPASTLMLKLSDAQTAALVRPAYQWRLVMTDPSGVVLTLLGGAFRVTDR